jgi:hypothetical protein
MEDEALTTKAKADITSVAIILVARVKFRVFRMSFSPFQSTRKI